LSVQLTHGTPNASLDKVVLFKFLGMAVLTVAFANSASAQVAPPAPAKPQLSDTDWLKNLDAFEGRRVEIAVVARHIGSQRIFTFGEKEGREIRVLIPNPSVDTANVGDNVTVIGTVRRFNATVFTREYRWYRNEDYSGVPDGALVIVAESVRSPVGADLVPGSPGR
jgi:hypothetical protein